MSIPRILIPENPVAIDLVFGQIQTAVAAEFTWLDHAFGKSQLLATKQNKKEYKYPAVHYKNNKYLDMLPSKEYGNTCWFIVDDPQDIEEYVPRKQLKLKANFSIVFWFNLNEIYPDSIYRDLELIKSQLYNFINNNIFYSNARVKLKNVSEGFSNIYKEYSTKEIEQQYLMQPYAALRFQGDMEIIGSCPGYVPDTPSGSLQFHIASNSQYIFH